MCGKDQVLAWHSKSPTLGSLTLTLTLTLTQLFCFLSCCRPFPSAVRPKPCPAESCHCALLELFPFHPSWPKPGGPGREPFTRGSLYCPRPTLAHATASPGLRALAFAPPPPSSAWPGALPVAGPQSLSHHLSKGKKEQISSCQGRITVQCSEGTLRVWGQCFALTLTHTQTSTHARYLVFLFFFFIRPWISRPL